LTRFLEEGDKTKITLRFRGREMAHQEFGLRLIERIKSDLEPFAVIEQYPKMEGRQMVMVLSPKKAVKPVAAPTVKKPAKPAVVAEPAVAAEAAEAVEKK
jgi:translation initiation factor IF-3